MRKLILFCSLSLLMSHLQAEVKLPCIFTDNAVLQREKSIHIWGWADDGEKISIQFKGKTYKTVANASGKWETLLDAAQAGGPYSMTITGKNKLTIQNLYLGDVWICSGQSNMQFRVKLSDATENDIQSPANKNIRLFDAKRQFTLEPQPDFQDRSWTEATEETIKEFSAVAYFFAQYLQPEINVPIGLINVSYGGSNIEAWFTRDDIKQYDDLERKYKEAKHKTIEVMTQNCLDRIKKWQQEGKNGPKPKELNPNAIPSSLYNGMIYPLIGLSIKGTIWYQGCSNVGNACQYKTRFPSLITSWRKVFNQGDFPFLFVQLANYLKPCEEPCDSKRAELREAQAMALQLPYTGMATAIDIGETDNIHPKNKRDVGKRLALEAERVVYNKKVVSPGPIFKKAEKKDNGILITFDCVGSGLKTKDNTSPKEFAIASGSDTFVWADAKIVGKNQIFLWSDKVKDPDYVRYGWAENPVHVNLYNSANLPAFPFRTDNRACTSN